jgi:hypothetical protein
LLHRASVLALIGLATQAGGGFSPGPEVGAEIPAFALPDQEGRSRSFADLKGPEGLVLVFFRSADW